MLTFDPLISPCKTQQYEIASLTHNSFCNFFPTFISGFITFLMLLILPFLSSLSTRKQLRIYPTSLKSIRTTIKITMTKNCSSLFQSTGLLFLNLEIYFQFDSPEASACFMEAPVSYVYGLSPYSIPRFLE